VIDPYDRWAEPERKPPYAGLPSFASVPWTEDPSDLQGADAVVVGAPFDALATERLGSREAPRAIRVASRPLGPEVGTGVDPSKRLRVLDYGDAPVIPYDTEATRNAIESTVGDVLAAGAIPVVLGGDHSITLPAARACAAKHGPLGLLHFDAHTDTAPECYLHTDNHGTMMRTLVEQGTVDPARYVQIGLRGMWPETDVFEWQREQGITHFTAQDVRRRGIDDVVAEALGIVGSGPSYLTVDIDSLDPAFSLPTGTPEPGGLDPRELLFAARRAGEELELAGIDLVEVVPAAWGTADVATVTAAGVIGVALTGVAARREDSASE
jgi:agmatinase